MSTATLAETVHQLPPTAYPPRKKADLLKDWLFERIHGNKLVYNTCWEDPRCDRAMLELNAESEVVMITSAGDNALAYLLDGPRQIHCVDVNPRQNALLELKLAGLQTLGWSVFFDLFGDGRRRDVATTYLRHLRPRLQKDSQEYWDANLHYFKPSGARAGLYFHGSSGVFAWGMRQLLRLDRRLFNEIKALFATRDLDEQRARYYELEPRLLNRLVGGGLRQRVSLSLVGVPDSQRRFIAEEAGGLKNYVREAFRRIFVELPVHDNYFYSLYFHGRYALDCCPAYLESVNFQQLAASADRIALHTTTIADFLRRRPGKYSHFVLLDHQDWLAANAPDALQEEWELVMANARPGARILLRSAASRPETVPDFVRQRCRFRNDLSTPQARRDRVGTYAGTFLLEVVNPAG
ncbi:MAG: BtaA family protein [Bacteroidota bacterium]